MFDPHRYAFDSFDRPRTTATARGAVWSPLFSPVALNDLLGLWINLTSRRKSVSDVASFFGYAQCVGCRSGRDLDLVEHESIQLP